MKSTLPFVCPHQVARIQLQIQETLQRQYSHHSSVQDAISQLDSELMDITKVIKKQVEFLQQSSNHLIPTIHGGVFCILFFVS